MSTRSKCFVLVPFQSHIEAQVEQSLRKLEEMGYTVWRTQGYSAIDQGRCKMAYDALIYQGAEELLWVDSDVGFQPDNVEQLRSLNVPVSCGVYPVKGWPVMTSQFKESWDGEIGENGGLVLVSFAATGFLHTRREVYFQLIEKLNLPECVMWGEHKVYPWFHPLLVPINGRLEYLGEDYSFSYRLSQCGIPIIADTRIKLKHWGKHGWCWEDYDKCLKAFKGASIYATQIQ